MARKAGEMVAAAKAQVKNLTVDEFSRAIDEGAVVVDLREAAELASNGTLPGAVNVPRGMLEFTADPATPYYNQSFQPDAKILLYCAAGSRSALAAATLQEMGYSNVAHLATGFGGWREAGKPIAR